MKRAAKVLIYDANDNVLVLSRSDTHPQYSGEADLPGGIINSHETFIEGVVREAQEEVGLDVAENKTLRLVYEFSAHDYEYQFFTVKLSRVKPTVKISWEHGGYIWEPLDDLLHTDKLFSKDDYMQSVVEWLVANN